MNETKSYSTKRNKTTKNESYKENKYVNISENPINIKSLTKKPNNKLLFINNQNHIDSINNNTNYKNIILKNMLTPNKKFIINGKSTSRNKKDKIDQNLKNIQNKQKSSNKNGTLKLILNNQEQDGTNIISINNTNNLNEIENKYKLILQEKNSLINKLKNEVDYYKNYYHNINMNMNIILPNSNSNNTIEANSNNRVSLGINSKKNVEGENMRNRIKNIFSLPKKENKYKNSNHLLQNNINNYNTIKTFVNRINSDDNINYNNIEATKDFVSHIKNNYNTISNDSLNINNNTKIKKNNNQNNNTMTLNNIIYRSNSNTYQKKGLKLKLGLQPNEFTLDNNYNSLEANRNYNNSVKNRDKEQIGYSLNLINSKTGSDNELDNFNSMNNDGISIDNERSRRFGYKNKNYFNNISSSPTSLYREKMNKIIIGNNSVESIIKKDSSEVAFNYRENFDKLKIRMHNLIKNLFELIEIQNKKNN